MEQYRIELQAALARARLLWRGLSPKRQGVTLLGAGFALLLIVLGLARHPAQDDGLFRVRRFDKLTERNQKYVKESYRDLLIAYERKDFARMAVDADKILQLVDDYNDTLSYNSIAARGLRQTEEDRLRKEIDERALRTRAEVAEMVRALQGSLPQALENAADRPPFLARVAEILAKDPNNGTALGWRRELSELDSGERRRKSVREIASLEIKGQGMLRGAAINPDSRAQLYEIMDRLRALDPANTYPAEWNQSLHRGR